MWSDQIDFYRFMKYPTPTQHSFYEYIDKKHIKKDTFQKESFSRKEKWELMNNYIESINKRSHLLQHIPGIRQIYLCNSITFNALHDNSDIDLCIISRHWFIRFARLFSLVFVYLIWRQRNKGKYINNAKKICLSFYIDENHCDLYHLRKRQGDIYLSYWLAHTVLLYTDKTLDNNHLINNNKKLLEYLPQHPQHQTIALPTTLIEGSSLIKKTIEYILSNRIGKFINNIIWTTRWYILQYKKSKLSRRTQQNIIISNHMLKFHQDRREIISHKRKTRPELQK